LTEEQKELVRQIQQKKAEIKAKKGTSGDNEIQMPRHYGVDREKDVETFEAHLTELGIDPSKAVARLRSRSRSRTDRTARKRTRSEEPMETNDNDEDEDMDEDHKRQRLLSKSRASRSRSRTRSKTPVEEGFKDFTQKLKAVKLARKAQFKMGKDARKGEGDRHVYDLKPKHLLTGKRSSGKTDRR
jgi:nucleolar GTP-binding protein